MDLIQHDTTESSMLNVTHRLKKLRCLQECTLEDPSKHYMETDKGQMSTFLLRHFPASALPPTLTPLPPISIAAVTCTMKTNPETVAPYPAKKELEARCSALVVRLQRDTAFCNSL